MNSNSKCCCRALRQHPVAPALKVVESFPQAVVLTSEYPAGGTLADFICDCCSAHDVLDTQHAMHVTQQLISMLELCHANKV